MVHLSESAATVSPQFYLAWYDMMQEEEYTKQLAIKGEDDHQAAEMP